MLALRYSRHIYYPAENDAANEEMRLIKQAKAALKKRGRELEIRRKELRKRVQEPDAAKSGQIVPIASAVFAGSALAFGIMMGIFGNRN